MFLYLAGFSQTSARSRCFDWHIPIEALGAIKQYSGVLDSFVFLKEEFRREPWLPDGEKVGSLVLGSIDEIRAKNDKLFTGLLQYPARLFKFSVREEICSVNHQARMIVPTKALSGVSAARNSGYCNIHIHKRWRTSVGLGAEESFVIPGTLDKLRAANLTARFPLRKDQTPRGRRAASPALGT